MSLHLISFKTCPFVQRAVITLKHKNIDFDITYIDLADPPDWFLEISPLEKVPVLKVDDEILFALRNNIQCINCESLEELGVIDGIAGAQGLHAKIAIMSFRVIHGC